MIKLLIILPILFEAISEGLYLTGSTEMKVVSKQVQVLLIAVMVSYSVNCQFHFVQAVYEPQTYPITHADTMTINKADLISGITIDVPSSATDSTWVKGGTNTIDGIATGYVKVPPGNSVSLGFNPDMRLDSVTIIVKNKANLYLTPIR